MTGQNEQSPSAEEIVNSLDARFIASSLLTRRDAGMFFAAEYLLGLPEDQRADFYAKNREVIDAVLAEQGLR